MAAFVKNDDSSEDKVAREMDVYLSESLNLYLLQYPLKPVFGGYLDVQSAKMRPKHGRVEMQVIDDKNTFNRQKIESTTLCSTTVEQQSSMGVGIVQNGELHITPVSTVMQMRPSFQNMKTREVIEDMSSEDEAENAETDAVPLQQVSMRRKESDRAESSRVQSFAFMQSQEEAEAWVPLNVYDPDTRESQDIFSGMYYTGEVEE